MRDACARLLVVGPHGGAFVSFVLHLDMSTLTARTVLPPTDPSAETEVLAIFNAFNAVCESVLASEVTLNVGDESYVLTDEVVALIRDAFSAMAEHQAVTISKSNTVLSTQEAAEMLGVSRPTLVRLLEEGEIPFEKPSRHRRVNLSDLLEYKSRISERRSAVLAEMTADAAEDDDFHGVNGFIETR